MRRFYSGSYTKTQGNFVIITGDKKDVPHHFKESAIYGAFCVVKNIIQRGNPTIPSEYLRDKLGGISQQDAYYLTPRNHTYWDKTIKGYENESDYPALTFFNEILPEYLGEYGFVRDLIIPEATFIDIIGSDTKYNRQQVDFYIPQLRLVIEIDGAQHGERMQRQKDSGRDIELRKHNVQVCRIKARDIKNNSAKLKKEMRTIKDLVLRSPVIANYKRCLHMKLPTSVVAYESVMRLQMVLLDALMDQTISIEDNEWRVYFSKGGEANTLLQYAYADIKAWIEAILKLLKIDDKLPPINVVDSEEKADLIINISLFDRYDDKCVARDKEYIVRTDYYYEADYYRVSVSETLDYKIVLGGEEDDRDALKYLLKNIFDFDDFHDGQLPIIMNVMRGRDTIGLLPTGAGKSLCYQFCAMLQPGITIVVDPIISLMQDQQRSMREKGICRNEMISSEQEKNKRNVLISAFSKGKYQMLWVAPERFQQEEFRESLNDINKKSNFCMAVIDEVHCLSEWGHDFRLSYMALVDTIREYCPATVLLGLTATASEFVLKDIRAEFGDEEPLSNEDIITLSSMDRPELEFIRTGVRNEVERKNVINYILDKHVGGGRNEAGTVFCPTVGGWYTGCNSMSTLLYKKYNNKFALYYGEMEAEEKDENLKGFLDNHFQIMICTKAFGMGIDKSDIRFTIHNSMPASVESFYQEAGRAGRDRQKATCYIIYNVSDRARAVLNNMNSPKKFLGQLRQENDYIKTSDLDTTFYFMKNNTEEESLEVNNIRQVLNDLSRPGGKVIAYNNNDKGDDRRLGRSKQNVEKALHKLKILGFVSSWIVNYTSLTNGWINVDARGHDELTDEEVLENFLAYVRKYDVDFSLDSERGLEYKGIWEGSPVDKKKSAVIMMIVKWTNENIIYQRFQCTKTMVEWCSPNVDNETFRRNLNGYFKISEIGNKFGYVAYNPTEWRTWFEIIGLNTETWSPNSKFISKRKAQELYAGLQRFLESYQYNTGLNYLDGLFRLLIKDEVAQEDFYRMEQALGEIMNMDKNDQQGILDETLSFGSHLNDVRKKDFLSMTLLKYFKGSERKVFEIMQDRYSLSIELSRIADETERIEWTI